MEMHILGDFLEFVMTFNIKFDAIISAYNLRGAKENAKSHVIRRFGQNRFTAQELTRWKVCLTQPFFFLRLDPKNKILKIAVLLLSFSYH